MSHFCLLHRWIAFGLIFLSWSFTVASTGSCQFITVNERGIGFFNYENDSGSCTRIITIDYLDAGVKAGQTFAVMACLLTSTALILNGFVHFVATRGRNCLWLLLRIIIYFSAWCTLLTYFIFGIGYCSWEEVECKMGPVATLTIINLLLLVGLQVLLFYVKAGPKPFRLSSSVQNENEVEMETSAGDRKVKNASSPVKETSDNNEMEHNFNLPKQFNFPGVKFEEETIEAEV